MSVPPSPDPLLPPAPPQVPVTRATPEKLVQLLVNIAGRLERLEGICARLDESIDRLERRFDGAECRWIAFNDTLHLLLMLVGNLPPLKQIAIAMLGVMAAGVFMLVLGIAIASHWPGMLTAMF